MSDPNDEPTAEEIAEIAQQELLESCLELAFAAYDEARRDKVADPVIFLLDCEDPVGEEIASAWLGAETIHEAVAQQKLENPGSDLTTAFARAFSWDESQREVPKVFDYLAPVFEIDRPADGFLAIAVTAGGASAFTVPFSARE